LERNVPARLTPAEGRRFAFPVGIAFLVIGAIILWRGHTSVATGFGTLGGLLLVAGVVVPSRLGPVYRAWMGLAVLISRVTTPIIMGIMYFVVIFPSGVLRRTLARNPISHVAEDGSYWVSRKGKGKGNLSRQF